MIHVVASTEKQGKDAGIGAGRCPLWEILSDAQQGAYIVDRTIRKWVHYKESNASTFGVRQIDTVA